MSLAVVLPSREQKDNSPEKGAARLFRSLRKHRRFLDISESVIFEDIILVICNIRLSYGNARAYAKLKRKARKKLDVLFMEKGVWSVLEHPDIKGIYPSSREQYALILGEVIVNRFAELIRILRGVGRLSDKEVTVTGQSAHLEYAIAKLITSVKSINILLPEGSEEPEEADLAFEETGIPVHITTDPEVLNRTALWIRFPFDHEDFDALPESFEGLIIDLGARKVIDTIAKTIMHISLEPSEKMKREIGRDILEGFDSDSLAGFMIGYCINAWGKSASEVSVRLGMRLSLKP
jgi:hypothetical protein